MKILDRWDAYVMATAVTLDDPDEAVRHLRPLRERPDYSAIARIRKDRERAASVLRQRIAAGDETAVRLAGELQIAITYLEAAQTEPRRRRTWRRVLEAWPLMATVLALCALTLVVVR
jgi:hypothetical protein